MKTFKDLLVKLNACSSACRWAGDMPIEEVVEKCHRGDWLLWLARNVNIDFQKLTLAKGYCAQTILHLMKDERSIKAVEAAINFGNGLTNEQQLKDAAAAAAAATYAYAAYAADAYAADAYASYAAADAASAASAAAAAYAYAAYAAAAAADVYAAAAAADVYAAAAAADVYAAAAAADAYTAAKIKNQQLTADICRKYIGEDIIKLVNNLLT